jgi:acyl-CoA synthetase (AMP-forming)/AMP-acid ligase II
VRHLLAARGPAADIDDQRSRRRVRRRGDLEAKLVETDGRPVPGVTVRVVRADGALAAPGEEGAICLQLPLPPGTLPTLWGDDDRYEASYLCEHPGYYLTGDGGFIDEDGYLFVMGRIDDVINVAGHRLSTGSIEAVLAARPVDHVVIALVHEDASRLPSLLEAIGVSLSMIGPTLGVAFNTYYAPPTAKHKKQYGVVGGSFIGVYEFGDKVQASTVLQFGQS